jgi:hypothetical protein
MTLASINEPPEEDVGSSDRVCGQLFTRCGWEPAKGTFRLPLDPRQQLQESLLVGWLD